MLNSVARRSGRLTRVSRANSSSVVVDHPRNNIPASIDDKVGKDLYLQQHHPLALIRRKIEAYFGSRDGNFEVFDKLSPIVGIKDNFDALLIPDDHVSRASSDTYYIDGERMLRTHMTVHQPELLRKGHRAFLMTGDVYRRDTVDASHAPVFHQMDGVRVFSDEELDPTLSDEEKSRVVIADLKASLEGMADALFPDAEKRWVDAEFPFTTDSLELEVFYQGDWLEVLGCGKIRTPILESTGYGGQHGWAFGMGLERLAMRLFEIPDIRLFWSTDPRFSSQFHEGSTATFVPFSSFPPCLKDITFWVDDGFHENDFHEIVRGVAGDLAEDVKLIDEFTHPQTGRMSRCFRVVYRAMDRSLTNEEIDVLQFRLRDRVTDKGYELR